MRALFCLVVALPLAAHADLRSDLQVRYGQLDKAIAAKNGKAVVAWSRANLASDFSYTSKDKHRYGRAEFEKQLSMQVGITKKVTQSATKVVSIKASGSTLSAVVGTVFDGILAFDSRPLRMVDKSEQVDTWVKSGGKWLLKTSVQTKDDNKTYQQSK